MTRLAHFAAAVILLGFSLPSAFGQSEGGVSLGDIARALRKTKPPAAPVKIDNDNLNQVMDQVETRRLNGAPVFSMDDAGKNFQISSPDGTCSLSFSANATAVLSAPYVADDMPQSELAKLDGPASIVGDTLQVSVYNGSSWDLKEITVGLTLVRAENTAARLANAKLLPAAATDQSSTPKASDLTVLLHLKASAAPLATAVFSQKLGRSLAPDQEWHWAIVEARGIPPSPISQPQQ